MKLSKNFILILFLLFIGCQDNYYTHVGKKEPTPIMPAECQHQAKCA